METFALYLLKSSVWLTGFAAVYFLFLRNERFFALNRIFLVSGIVFSIVFPFFTWHYTVIFPLVPTVNIDQPQVQAVTVVKKPFEAKDLLLYIYIAGALYLIFRIIKQTTSVWQVIRKSETLHFNSVKLIRTNRYPASFSFFSFVFVNPSTHEHEINEIVNHEQEHIRQRHWIDLLLFEILCTLQWFNPVAWIYGRFIRQNHEFLADEQALRRTSNPAVYRAALLNQMFGGPVISLANSFSYSINKKRFNMMKQITYSPFRKLKLLLALPLIAGVFYAFATPEYKFVQANPEQQMNQPQSQKINNSIPANTNQEKVVKGKIIDEQGKPLKNATIIVSGTTLGTVSDASGNFELKMTDESPLVFSYVGYDFVKVEPDFSKEMEIKMKRVVISIDAVGNGLSNSEIVQIPGPVPVLTLVDGKETSEEDLKKINTDQIESIDVLRNKETIEKYGEKGKNGVVLITMKKDQASVDKEKSGIQVIGYGKIPKNIDVDKPDSGVRIRTIGTSGNPLFVIDGIISKDKKPEDIDPNTIQSMSVWKEEKAIEKYGDQGKNGVVEITTKSALQKNQPLYVLDGKEIDQAPSFNNLSPETIQSVEVLKGESATKLYGEKGKDGAILIKAKTGISTAQSTIIEKRDGIGSEYYFDNNQPLFVIDGVISKNKLNNINPETIQSINVLKYEMAVTKYGKNGENGVIEITLKTKGETETFVIVEQMPQFPGGVNALHDYLNANFRYPAEAIEKGLSGKVYVNFLISKTGTVSDVKVTKGVNPILDNEAVRLVKTLPNWIPGKQRGVAVDVSYTVPVEFNLPQKK